MNKRIEFSELYALITDIFSSGGVFNFMPGGKSMYPTIIGNKDEVLLEKPDEIRKNDIVFYKRENGDLVMHRVVKISGDEYIMRGDNQCFNEHGISREMIFAIVTSIKKDGKSISRGDKDYYLRFSLRAKMTVLRVLNKIKGVFKR